MKTEDKTKEIARELLDLTSELWNALENKHDEEIYQIRKLIKQLL
ncbi:hypothetical protein [Clostridium hydrogeniformans]|nr:hypothetical protein [Clostridium hydrogeniformans]